ncbi:MAG TPA: hypothetical protein VFU48_11400 [Nitrospira sp.]|nr:hypothetical protein [Nitrospira sp.]
MRLTAVKPDVRLTPRSNQVTVVQRGHSLGAGGVRAGIVGKKAIFKRQTDVQIVNPYCLFFIAS